jgi:hypothetical protein
VLALLFIVMLSVTHAERQNIKHKGTKHHNDNSKALSIKDTQPNYKKYDTQNHDILHNNTQHLLSLMPILVQDNS